MTAFSTHAGLLLKQGYSPVPLDPVTGVPAIRGWDQLRDRQMSAQSILDQIKRNPDFQLGVVGGFSGLVPIDVDTDDEAFLLAFCSALPRPAVIRRGTKGFVAFYRSLEPIGGCKICTPEGKPVVEVLSTGNVTIPPSRHRKTGVQYTWVGDHELFNTRVEHLSVITPKHIAALRKALAPWCPPPVEYVPPVVVPFVNPKLLDQRYKSYSATCLTNECRALATLRDGRNLALYRAACKLGKWVHHGYLTHHELHSELMSACKSNGSIESKGVVQCRQTIESGLNKSRGDPLPALRDNPLPLQRRG